MFALIVANAIAAGNEVERIATYDKEIIAVRPLMMQSLDTRRPTPCFSQRFRISDLIRLARSSLSDDPNILSYPRRASGADKMIPSPVHPSVQCH